MYIYNIYIYIYYFPIHIYPHISMAQCCGEPVLEAYDKEERTERSTEDYVSTGPKDADGMVGRRLDFSVGAGRLDQGKP